MLRFAAVAVLALAPLALPAHASALNSVEASTPTAFQSDRISVLVEGDEGLQDVILIPGLSSAPAIWQDTVDQLKGRYRIHRIHVNGFGGAPVAGNAQPTGTPAPVLAPLAEDIARYIDQNSLQKPIVIGHSMGGTLGLTVAARHPDRVGKLMVVDMLPFVGAMFGPVGTTAQSIQPTAQAVWGMQAGLAPDAYMAAATATITGMVDNAERRELALEHMRGSDQALSAAAYYDLMVTDLRPELANITAPVSVLYVPFRAPNMTSEVTDMIYTASFSARPDFSLKRIDDSAHFIMFDQPAVFAREVEAFLSAN